MGTGGTTFLPSLSNSRRCCSIFSSSCRAATAAEAAATAADAAAWVLVSKPPGRYWVRWVSGLGWGKSSGTGRQEEEILTILHCILFNLHLNSHTAHLKLAKWDSLNHEFKPLNCCYTEISDTLYYQSMVSLKHFFSEKRRRHGH